MISRRFLTLMGLTLMALSAMAQQADDVLAAARKANHYFMQKHPDPTQATFVRKVRPSSLWTRAVYYEGLMALQAVDPQETYVDYALRWARFHQWTPRNGVTTTDADDQCCCQTYLALLPYAGDDAAKVLPIVRDNLDRQMASGRHNYWSWIDAVQMALPLYAQVGQATADARYMDYGMKAYRWTRNECGGGCFNEQTGLWYRDADFVPPYREPDGQECYWSRGNGWVYAALVRTLQTVGKRHKYYKELKADFLTMTRAIAACQRQDGLWNVSMTSTHYAGPELTGTALFLYGLSWGISQGLIKAKTYRPVADRAWQGMERICLHPDGFLGYVQGTGKQPSDGQPVSYTSVPDFEDFGTGCFLLGATEYYKLLGKR